MSDVARLDFTAPPPGYAWDERRRGYLRDIHDDLVGPLEDAWKHYKARFNPPGMFVCADASRPMGDYRSTAWCWGPLLTIEGVQYCLLFKVSDHAARPAAPEARAAAWRWYEARLVIYNILRKINPPREFWPLVLFWSDEEWIEVHGFLATLGDVLASAKGPPIPQVLLG